MKIFAIALLAAEAVFLLMSRERAAARVIYFTNLCSSAATLSMTTFQSPFAFCRNKRAVGYQSGAARCRTTRTGRPIRTADAVSWFTWARRP